MNLQESIAKLKMLGYRIEHSDIIDGESVYSIIWNGKISFLGETGIMELAANPPDIEIVKPVSMAMISSEKLAYYKSLEEKVKKLESENTNLKTANAAWLDLANRAKRKIQKDDT
jgi:hypothetical protein